MKKQLLLLGMMATSLVSFGQTALSEDFEGDVFPPTGWTIVSTHATNNWILINNPDYVIGGSQSAAVNWVAANQDENLISPSFSLEGYTSAFFNFTARVGYEYMVDPFANGNLFAKISTDGGVTWTQLWVEEDEGVYDDYDPRVKTLDISSYVGQANVMVKFQYVANDADLVVIDDISVTGSAPCTAPSGFVYAAEPQYTSVTLGWDSGSSADYEYEYGLADFTPGTGTTVAVSGNEAPISGLVSGTAYDFYIRTVCGDGNYSEWVGPITFYTAFEPANLPYSYGFETGGLDGWDGVTTAGAVWGTMAATEAMDFVPYEGDVAMGAGAVSVASDSWLFSRPIWIPYNNTVTVSYYVMKRVGAGEGNINNLEVTLGSAPTVSAQTLVISEAEQIENLDWELRSTTFETSATGSGVYYIGFHYTAPAQVATNYGWAVIDDVQISSVQDAEQFDTTSLSVFPNPANNVVTVAGGNSLVNNVAFVDINGRTVKTVNFTGVAEAQINVSELAAGMYMVNIATDNGTVTKKVVKN